MKLMQITFTVVSILFMIQIKVLYGYQEMPSCGRRLVNHKPLITNGFHSNEGAWPWHAALYHIGIDQRTAYKCGGSILTSNAILTAAHCVYENSRPIIPERVLIELGRHNLKIIAVYTQQFEVYQIIPHSNYNKSDEANDIAIIKLSTEATFNNYVQPICLWDSNKVDISELIGRYGSVIGFGITETNKVSNILRQAVMPIVSLTTCLESNRPFFGFFLSDKNFCAGFRNGTSVCNGDSGGSIAFMHNGVYRIRGIVSLTVARHDDNGLCDTKEYVVFTDVPKYLPWIVELIPALKPPQMNSGINHQMHLTVENSSYTEGACLIPADLSETMQVYYGSQPDLEIAKGSYVASFVDIIYKCKANYRIDSRKTENFCLNGKWGDPDHPKCIKLCSPLNFSGITTIATCEIDGETISCHQTLRPNTIARLNCAIGYRKPSNHFFDVLRCGNDGEWDHQPLTCEPICGIDDATEAAPNVLGVEMSNNTKVPWHVGIFKDINDDGSFVQICGGTILNAKVVISAVHCFWDGFKDTVYNASIFKVVAGKYYRDFYATEPIKSQTLNIAHIEHKPEYSDYAGLFAYDIALLILDDYIVFNSYIKPICLETLLYSEKNVPPGLIGRVAGWGLETSGDKSREELKILDLPAIEYNECKEKFSVVFRPFITPDKFCAGFTDGRSVCQGDGGGGLVFPKKFRGHLMYFLRGIVNIGATKGGSCDNEKYSIFTNIQHHIEMITDIESKNRPE